MLVGERSCLENSKSPDGGLLEVRGMERYLGPGGVFRSGQAV